MTGKIDEMLYITESSFTRQILLLSKLSSKAKLELVIWLYPESSAESIIGLHAVPSTKVNALPVTTYESHIISRCTQRVRITDELIKAIALNESKLIGECDSLCVYHLEKFEWEISVILHEGVILIKDRSLLVNLEALNFMISPHAPSWW